MKSIRVLGDTIKNLCDNKGISKGELSDKLGCPISDIDMCLYGRKILSYAQLEIVATLLKTSVDGLFDNSNSSYISYMDCMNDFTKEENRELIMDIIYDYLDVCDAVEQ